MYYSLVNSLTNKTIFYKIDVINDGFVITCKYRSIFIKAYYSNYCNIKVIINGVDASSITNVSRYNLNDLNEIFTMIDDIIYNKQMWLKTLYLMKYINNFTNQDVSYILSYLN